MLCNLGGIGVKGVKLSVVDKIVRVKQAYVLLGGGLLGEELPPPGEFPLHPT